MGIFNPAYNTFSIWTSYGDSTDGDVVINVDTSLNKDMNYHNLTINAGKKLYTNGYSLICSGTLTNNGTIDFSALSRTGPLSRTLPGGANGAPGGLNDGADGNANITKGLGFEGGDSGDGTGGGGANGGSPSIADANAFEIFLAFLNFCSFFGVLLKNAFGVLNGGGGAGGAGDGIAHLGGDGGGAAGFLQIIAKYLDNSLGTISANGFHGANGTFAGTGGGGGGAGGYIRLLCTNVPTGTFTVNGGAAGLGIGAGTNGTAGHSGIIEIIQVH